MKVIGRVIGLGLLAFSISASAYNVGQHESKRDKAAPVEKEAPADKKAVATPKYSPTQVFCIKQRRPGSRVVQNKCQTVAQWKQEFDEKAMRQYMIKARGKTATWESP